MRVERSLTSMLMPPVSVLDVIIAYQEKEFFFNLLFWSEELNLIT